MKKANMLVLISFFALSLTASGLTVPALAADKHADKAKPVPVSSEASDTMADAPKSSEDKATESKKATDSKTTKAETPKSETAKPAAETARSSEPAPAQAEKRSAPQEQATKNLKVGNLELSDIHVSSSGDHVDIFLSVKNTGKIDDKITGAGTTWTSGDVFQISKDKDGKEKEGPVAIDLPAGKSVDVAKGETWIRIKDVKAPKESGLFPLALYFRSSPNAAAKVSFKDGGSGFLDWMKK